MNYVLSDDLQESVTVSELTGRPLLLKGEPGTGKTLLADYVSREINWPLFRWHIKSTTTAKDGLYFYDALTRLNDSRFQEFDKKTSRDVSNIEDYIRFEPMGEAFSLGKPSLLLIDEIDKADIEFPNDLLQELDAMEFTILETGKKIKAQTRPLVIITSNNEKELPDAFLRRCVFHYIDFPDWQMMEKIVEAHYPEIDKKLVKESLEIFYKLREKELRKKPSTSELVDWIGVLLQQGGKLDKKRPPFLGALIKDEQDLESLK